jgi:hypothetical protein
VGVLLATCLIANLDLAQAGAMVTADVGLSTSSAVKVRFWHTSGN